MVVAGSHRVVARFLEARPHLRRAKMKVVRKALLASDGWFKALGSPAGEPDRSARLMHAGHEIGGIPVRVAELTGEPGDMIVGHPWLLHAIARNCGDKPRFMCVQRIAPPI